MASCRSRLDHIKRDRATQLHEAVLGSVVGRASLQSSAQSGSQANASTRSLFIIEKAPSISWELRVPTGSPAFTKMIGTIWVASWAAIVAGVPGAAMTSTLCFTLSAARAGKPRAQPRENLVGPELRAEGQGHECSETVGRL